MPAFYVQDERYAAGAWMHSSGKRYPKLNLHQLNGHRSGFTTTNT